MNILPPFYEESRTSPQSSNDSSWNMERMNITRRISEDEERIAHDRFFRINSISSAHTRASRTPILHISGYSSFRTTSTSKTKRENNHHLNFSDSDAQQVILKAAFEALDSLSRESKGIAE